MKNLIKRIDGIVAELDFESGESPSVFLSVKRGITEYTGSLQCAQDQGVLADGDKTFKVSPKSLDKIEEWALANGY